MGKIKDISQRESPKNSEQNLPKELLEFLDNLLRESEKSLDSNLGFPTDPSEYGWFGGYNSDGKRRLSDEEVDQYLGGDLGELTGFEEVLLRIVRAYPLSEIESRSEKLKRVRTASRALIGQASPASRSNSVSEEDLERIARAYFNASLQLKSPDQVDHVDQYIEPLIHRYISKIETPSKEDLSNQTRRAKKRFYSQFQRLMFKVTCQSATEQIERVGEIRKTADTLLKIAQSPPLPKTDLKSTDS